MTRIGGSDPSVGCISDRHGAETHNMAHNWHTSGTQLAHTWHKSGTYLAQPGTRMYQLFEVPTGTWHKPGTNLAQTWHKPGTHMAHIWHIPGTLLPPIWHGRGRSLAQIRHIRGRPGTHVGPHPPHASVLRLTPSPRPAREKPRRLARWQAARRNPSGLRACGVSFSPPPPSAPTAGQQPGQMWHLACWSAAAPAFTTSRHDARCSGAPADTCRTWLRPCAGAAVAYPRGLASPPHAPTCRGLSRGLHGERVHAEGAAGISGGGGAGAKRRAFLLGRPP